MDSRKLAYSLKVRANIFHTRAIVAEHAEKPPRDWEGLELKIAEETKTNTELNVKLSNYLKSELENNYKIISLYQLSPAQAKAFTSLFASLSSQKKVAYPAVQSGEQLAKLSQNFELAHLETNTNNSTIVLTRRRTFTLRKKIDRASLGTDAQTLFDTFDDVYGVADYHWQTFDIIRLDHTTNQLELRADYTRSENSYQNNKQIDRSLGELIGWIIYGCSKLKITFGMTTATNLFPAISHFTFSDDGLISKLNFMTPQGSVKQDTMKKGEDLRSELFYKKGLEAVDGKITPFDISVIWHNHNSFGPGQEIELTIPSRLAVASTGDSAIQTYAILRYCSTDEDTRLLVGKLNGAVKDESKA